MEFFSWVRRIFLFLFHVYKKCQYKTILSHGKHLQEHVWKLFSNMFFQILDAACYVWRKVTIDYYFPIVKVTLFIFSQCRNNSMWRYRGYLYCVILCYSYWTVYFGYHEIFWWAETSSLAGTRLRPSEYHVISKITV